MSCLPAKSPKISAPAFGFQNGLQETSECEMCFGPTTLSALAQTRLESGIKKCMPHCLFAGPSKGTAA